MLQTTKQLTVRFCEVDAMHIVWHGHYVKYLEDGREEFARHYGLGYYLLERAGYGIPIVEMELSYKKSARYGDTLEVETRYVPSATPRICFDYRIRHADTRQLICTARTTQVFTNAQHQLQLLPPPCFTEWQQHWLPSLASLV
ncbi:acyl-CoA thioesterase [Hymenobacter cavernae]|uniref:4-hydroxybenzoyl-CoA thioesterase n=1 Tax=Hymenobacter cavernae TaxID=2044852 RepID=A0ABQ1TUL4_9BACT|nr:acyl-CoA thioesterase [Hymenobacter cavernae]GGF03912.1 4-hydroxybenzoyl-CoA thioesterase [Hymenobacter cavernae]